MTLAPHIQILVSKAFVRLRSWTTAHLDEAAGPAVALQATAKWTMHAAHGGHTLNGPYRHLYVLAADIMSQQYSSRMINVGQYLLNSIPKPSTQQSCDLARLYAIVYQFSLFGDWTEDEIKLVSTSIEQCEHGKLVSVRDMVSMIVNGPAAHPIRCAVEAVQEHKCVGDDKCTKASILWEDEANRSQAWQSEIWLV